MPSPLRDVHHSTTALKHLAQLELVAKTPAVHSSASALLVPSANPTVKDVNSRWNVARITTAHHQPSAEKESAVNQNARTYVLHRIADLTQTARQQPIGNLAASVVKDSLNKAELAYASASDVKPK